MVYKNFMRRTSFANQLRRAIKQSDESIYQIAKETGIAEPVLYRFHNGLRENLRLDVAEKLARYLGLTLK